MGNKHFSQPGNMKLTNLLGQVIIVASLINSVISAENDKYPETKHESIRPLLWIEVNQPD